ncbi:hypothetical protein [Coraliomargarita akajimensis]|uniref:Uncharacterized protein n=1 Tax=Coraliomargarita akajimensis (strain DSM 45221 / IAM 15411 / JCM 23193 / KCTC 12865 / 04OKA010-24) TaxID=583355 RepID=D5EQ03_CORAD|nr:hypothetical protein [Coraliomargarita akajimensis]ADE55736.1 hypothetical protein Caka_2721 [Coraliomargarita akajimensis DSM 45221]
MSQSLQTRPIFLLLAGAVTLLVGILIGNRIGGGAGTLKPSPVAAEQASPDAAERALAATDEVTFELAADAPAAALSPELARLSEFLQISKEDPLLAAEDALGSANDLDRISKMALLLAGASSEDMPGIAELITAQRNGFEEMQQLSMLYYAWGRLDAPTAVAHAEAQGGRRSGMGVAVALSSWASLDPASARTWVDGMESPERYQRGLLIGWSENSPLQALQYLSQQGSESNLMNRWVAPSMARNLVAARGVTALDDLAAMPSGRNRNQLLERLADELGETQPEATAARLTQIDDPEILKTAVPEVAQEWAQNDPQAAVDFVNNYTENTELYSEAMAEVVEEWAEREPYEAGKFLNEQPATPALDRSVAEYSREVAQVDPEGAMSFAVSVYDEKLRTDTISRVARDWQRKDAAAYQAWAEANPELAPKAGEE